MKTAFLEKLSPSLPKLDKGITIGYFPFFSSIKEIIPNGIFSDNYRITI